MKKRLFFAALTSMLLLSGCGGQKSEEMISNGFTDSTPSEPASEGGFFDYDYAADDAWEETPIESAEAPAAAPASSTARTSSGLSANEISREMLVYSCHMSIDTLNFSSTLDSYRSLLSQYEGFIETENYDDGGSYGRWYSDTETKWQSYSATVRIPSRNYDAFCTSAGGLGDLRSKNASVQNLSSEYNDLSTALEIYEAKEERYISLLADITEDEYAVAIERELTELQIQIAGIKSRMNKINTDVTYSYVYISINEVKEYVSEPIKTDTFADRLLNTFMDTGRDFADFLEWALFAIIHLTPYLVLIGIIIIVILLAKKRRARKARLCQDLTAQETPVTQTVSSAQAAQSSQTVSSAQAAQSSQTVSSAQAAQSTQTVSSAQADSSNEHPAETK